MFADQVKDAIDERVAAEITELAESFFAAEVGVAIRVATRTAQRTLSGDFDGEHGGLAGENLSPSAEYLAGADAGTRLDRGHRRLDARLSAHAALIVTGI
jgi:hypothetical protein